MTGGAMTALGGLGVFLLGMIVMTDGLKSLTQAGMRNMLARFTRSPLSGAVTGAASTAVIQSSSATTVVAVGFVGAGLLTFPQALGIIYGANIGTTVTGWLVALLGFKLKLGEAVLPLILVGVLIRMFGAERARAWGFVIAGFGLIFVGIDGLREGLEAYAGMITPESFPRDTIGGRLVLVLLGMAVTVVTQSSSAGVVMALAALNTGAINFPQAAAMVIGMNIGTTATALIAAIGGGTQARRTALGHVFFNVLTGVGAFVLLSPYVYATAKLFPTALQAEPELSLVIFHTLFNLLGVAAVLPFTRQFAAMITRLVPERGNPLTRRLDDKLIAAPGLAIAAARATVTDLIAVTLEQLQTSLATSEVRGMGHPRSIRSPRTPTMEDTRQAVADTERYLDFVKITPDAPAMFEQKQACIHLLDHLHRLGRRLRDHEHLEALRTHPDMRGELEQLLRSAGDIVAESAAITGPTHDAIRQRNREIKAFEKAQRRAVIERAARDELSTDAVLKHTDAVRMLRRLMLHLWHITRWLHSLGEEGARDGDRADQATSIIDPTPGG